MSVAVRKRVPSGGDPLASLELTGADGHALFAIMDIDPVVHDGGLDLVVPHEIGHLFNLDHCAECNSVMGQQALAGRPTPCDHRAIKLNGGYTGTPPQPPGGGGGGGGGGTPPAGCARCTVLVCRPTCRGRLGECETGSSIECYLVSGCCGDNAGGTSALCGDWEPAQQCEFGAACCRDPGAPLPELTCGGDGWFEQQAACDAGCFHGCDEGVGRRFAPDGRVEAERACWTCGPCVPQTPTFSMTATAAGVGQPVSFSADAASILDPPAPWWDLGNGTDLPGNPLTYAYAAPGVYNVILTATDRRCGTAQLSLPRTIEVLPCVSAGCPTGTCGAQIDNCGAPVWCGQCCTSSGCPPASCGLHVDNCGNPLWCGECGCQPTGGCAPGACGWQTNSCGAQVWCGECGCQSSGCPAGECGWITDNCGQPLWCGICNPCSSPEQPDPNLPPCP
jgi:hypothetical protein